MTLLAILLLVVFGITMASRKITRGLEFANLTSIGIQLLPRGLVTSALPPEGSDATLLGGQAGMRGERQEVRRSG